MFLHRFDIVHYKHNNVFKTHMQDMYASNSDNVLRKGYQVNMVIQGYILDILNMCPWLIFYATYIFTLNLMLLYVNLLL
jgi:hypothetical protein